MASLNWKPQIKDELQRLSAEEKIQKSDFKAVFKIANTWFWIIASFVLVVL
jgi:hypothetical protein